MSENNKENETSQSSPEPNAGCDTTGVADSDQDNKGAEHPAEGQNERSDDPKRSWTGPEWIAAISTAVIAFTTIVYALFTYQLWQTAVQQAETTKTAAEAAVSAAETAKETLEISQRAYLYASAPVFSLNESTVIVPIDNHGRLASPSASIEIKTLRTTAEGSFIERTTNTYGGDRTPIPPGTNSYSAVVPLEWLTAEGIDAFRIGSQQFRIVVSIDYDTGFDKRDTTTFCFLLRRSLDRWDACPVQRFIDLEE